MTRYTIEEYLDYLNYTHTSIAKEITRNGLLKYNNFYTVGAFEFEYKNRNFECQILWDRLKIDDTWYYNVHNWSPYYLVSEILEHAMRSVQKEINNNQLRNK